MTKITEERIERAINKMKPNRAAGTDDLTSSFIKGSQSGIIAPLVEIFKKSFDNGVTVKYLMNGNWLM